MGWQALGTIIAIIGIVLVASGIIVFIGHMIIGVFDTNKKVRKQTSKEVLNYNQYQQLGNVSNEVNKEIDFDAVAAIKEEKLKEEMEKDAENDDIYKLLEDNDDSLVEIENRINQEAETNVNSEETATAEAVEEVAEETAEEVTEAAAEEPVEEIEDLDFDIDDLINEISDSVVEEEVANAQNKETDIGLELESYSIDEMLQQAEENEEIENEVDEELAETAEEVDLPETFEDEANDADVETEDEIDGQDVVEDETAEEVAEDFEETYEDVNESETEELVDEVTEIEEPQATEEVVVPVVEKQDNEELKNANETIESLKAQLASLNQQLTEARTNKETTFVDMTEEQCLARLEMLEERLKVVKKDFKTNQKEYRPLKKVMNDLEKYQTKLRRKDTMVAKKKVALYGVNNYVDIDKEKAEKLANELELLDGLRLSVAHCEEVINANKDRYPILERTHNILETQIAQIENDIEQTNATLQKIREKNGKGNN